MDQNDLVWPRAFCILGGTMNYEKMTKSELITRIEELEQFNQQLMEEKVQDDRLYFP